MPISDSLNSTSAVRSQSTRRTPRSRWLVPTTIALIVTIVGLRIGVPIYRQAAAIRMIEECGGYVEVRPAGPAFVTRWLGDGAEKYLGEVVTVGTRYTHGYHADFDLRALRALPHVEELTLLLVDNPDADLRHVAALTNLKDLDLSDTGVGDAGLAHLEGLTQLESLSLMSTRVTDAGLRHLHGMTRLKFLDLTETEVTDAGIDDLKSLTALEMVFAHGMRVTDSAEEKLKQSLPRVEICRSLLR